VINHGTTHDVRIDRSGKIVVKRFRSRGRSEPAREWAALTLLAEFAPGLAPARSAPTWTAIPRPS